MNEDVKTIIWFAINEKIHFYNQKVRENHSKGAHSLANEYQTFVDGLKEAQKEYE